MLGCVRGDCSAKRPKHDPPFRVTVDEKRKKIVTKCRSNPNLSIGLPTSLFLQLDVGNVRVLWPEM